MSFNIIISFWGSFSEKMHKIEQPNCRFFWQKVTIERDLLIKKLYTRTILAPNFVRCAPFACLLVFSMVTCSMLLQYQFNINGYEFIINVNTCFCDYLQQRRFREHICFICTNVAWYSQPLSQFDNANCNWFALAFMGNWNK